MQDFASFLGRLGYRDDFNSCPSHHLDELHLVELVLPEEAARVLAVRARLRAETWRECAIRERERALVKNLASVQVRDGHLSMFLRALYEFGPNFWQTLLVNLDKLEKAPLQ